MLGRYWNDDLQTLWWIMLNPSMADAEFDDPTIKKCIGFAKRFGFGSIEVVNLFALRATDPQLLWCSDDPVGPRNDQVLREVATRIGPDNSDREPQPSVIAAWGTKSHRIKVKREGIVAELFAEYSCALWSLGWNKAGLPYHPLMLSYDRKPSRWVMNQRN